MDWKQGRAMFGDVYRVYMWWMYIYVYRVYVCWICIVFD